MQFIENARLKSQGVGKLGAHGIAGMLLVEFGEGAVQHGLADDQFADQVHDRVNARGIHTKSALGNGDGSGARSRRLGSAVALNSFHGTCGRLRRLGFQQIAKQFMLGHLRSSDFFDADFGDNRRDPATVEQLFLGLRAGKRSFHEFDIRGRHIVFRAQGYDGAASVKNVANELKCRGAHEAVRINAKSDVVNRIAAVDGLGNHELFVFRPGKPLRR